MAQHQFGRCAAFVGYGHEEILRHNHDCVCQQAKQQWRGATQVVMMGVAVLNDCVENEVQKQKVEEDDDVSDENVCVGITLRTTHGRCMFRYLQEDLRCYSLLQEK